MGQPRALERSRVRFSLLETKGLNELLQENRDAVIEREGNLGGREPCCHLIPATRDQLGTIRSHKLMKHFGMMGDRFFGACKIAHNWNVGESFTDGTASA